ncbi:MAG: DUF47 family protein [Clostridia bacterium]|nr:DUF47 family protein [Clostridia bacterium]
MKKLGLNYYDKFIENSEIALKMSEILKDYSENFDYDMSEVKEKKVHSLERDADKNIHAILKYLVIDFLPPIDREDIVLITNKLDDVIDNIDAIVINIDILDVKEIRLNFIKFAKLINKMCKNINGMMTKLKTSKKYDEIHEFVVTINKLEGEGDKLYETTIRDLFATETNPIEVIKWHKIYMCAETFYDSCESLANTIGEVIMKNL